VRWLGWLFDQGPHAPASAQLATIFEASDGRVVGLHRNTGERNGKQLDTDCRIVFEVEDGKIESGTEHFFDLHNWDQFWS
jgi:ketosteroid isomerase-like protein